LSKTIAVGLAITRIVPKTLVGIEHAGKALFEKGSDPLENRR